MKTFDELPVEVQEKMLDEQVMQGNSRNPKVFRERIKDGFCWSDTRLGHDGWYNTLNGDYSAFYAMYPKHTPPEIDLTKLTPAEIERDYVMRNGGKFRVICTDKIGGDYPIVVLINEQDKEFAVSLSSCGNFSVYDKEHRYGLIPRPVEKFEMDEPVMVRDSEDMEWERRHYRSSEGGIHTCWGDGSDSFTVRCLNNYRIWKFVRKPTPEELKR